VSLCAQEKYGCYTYNWRNGGIFKKEGQGRNIEGPEQALEWGNNGSGGKGGSHVNVRFRNTGCVGMEKKKKKKQGGKEGEEKK